MRTEVRRKYTYLSTAGDPVGLNPSMDTFMFQFPQHLPTINWNLLYRLGMDSFLAVDLGLDATAFDFHALDLPSLYGIGSNPGGTAAMSAGDSKTFERAMWDLRYQLTEKDDAARRKVSRAWDRLRGIYAAQLRDMGFDPAVVDAALEKLYVVEAKMISGAYIGFSAVGMCRIPEAGGGKPCLRARAPHVGIDEILIETVTFYETHVGFSRAGLCRVGSRDVPYSEDLLEHIRSESERFTKTSGFITWLGYSTFHPRYYFLKRVPRFRSTGVLTQHEIHMIQGVAKRVCDERGVVVQMRLPYQTFALEYCYLAHASYHKHRRWRMDAGAEALVQRYKALGCDEDILREIMGRVGAWRRS